MSLTTNSDEKTININVCGGMNTGYLSLSGGVITGDVMFSPGTKLIFAGGDQLIAYTNQNNGALTDVLDKCYYMRSSDTATIFDNDLYVQDNVVINGNITFGNNLPITKIDGLNGELNNNRNNIENNRTNIITNTNSINVINTNLINQNNINNLTTTKLLSIDASLLLNKDKDNNHDILLSQQTNQLNSIENNINENNIILNHHNANLLLLNSTVSSYELLHNDFSNTLLMHGNSINLMASELNSIATQDNIDQLEFSINNLNTENDILKLFKNDQIINNENVNLTISDNTTILNTHDSKISELTIRNDSNNIALLTHAQQLSILNGDILTKENKITNTNRLNANMLGYGTINNEQLQTLFNINTNYTVQDQFNILTEQVNTTLNYQSADDDFRNNQSIYNDTNILAVLDLTSYNTIQTDYNNSNNIAITEVNDTLSLLNNVVSSTQLINTVISQVIETKQPIISETNLLPSNLIYIDIDNTLDEKLETIDTLLFNKQNKIDSLNRLDINHVDISNSALRFVNISSNLQQKINSIDFQISSLTGLQNNDSVSFQAIEDNFQLLNNTLNSKQSTITNINTIDIDCVTNLPTTISNINDSISLLTNVDSNTLTNIQAITSNVNNLLNYNTENDIDIQSITDGLQLANYNISQKQDKLSLTNKLPIQFIDDLSSNLSNINSDISSVNSSVQQLVNSDILLNSSIVSMTNTLNSKQSTLSVTNKLNPEFITGGLTSTKVAYLSSIASDLQLQLNSLSSAISNLQSSSTTQLTTLNQKANINNPIFTGIVETPSLKIPTNSGISKVLTSDMNGNATWQTPAASSSAALTAIQGVITIPGSIINYACNSVANLSLTSGTWLIFAHALILATSNNTGAQAAYNGQFSSSAGTAGTSSNAGGFGTAINDIFTKSTANNSYYNLSNSNRSPLPQPNPIIYYTTSNITVHWNVQLVWTTGIVSMPQASFYAIKIA